MKKRILSLFMAVLMIICVIPAISLVSYAGDTVTVEELPDDTNREHFGNLIAAYGDIWARYGDKVKAKLAKYEALNDPESRVSDEVIAEKKAAYETARDTYSSFTVRDIPTSETYGGTYWKTLYPSAASWEEAQGLWLEEYADYITAYNAYAEAQKEYEAARDSGRYGDKKIANFYLNFTDVAVENDSERFVRILDYYCTAGKGNFGYYEELWYDDGHLISFIDMANISYDDYSAASNLSKNNSATNFARYLDASVTGIEFDSEEERTAFLNLYRAYGIVYDKYGVDYATAKSDMEKALTAASGDETDATYLAKKAIVDEYNELGDLDTLLAKYKTEQNYDNSYLNPASRNYRHSYIKVIGGNNIGNYYMFGSTNMYDDKYNGTYAASIGLNITLNNGFVHAFTPFHSVNNATSTRMTGPFINQLFTFEQTQGNSTAVIRNVGGSTGNTIGWKANNADAGYSNIWQISGITAAADADGYYGGFTSDMVYRDNGFAGLVSTGKTLDVNNRYATPVYSILAFGGYSHVRNAGSDQYTNVYFDSAIASMRIARVRYTDGTEILRYNGAGLGTLAASGYQSQVAVLNDYNFNVPGLVIKDNTFDLRFTGRFVLDENNSLDGKKYAASLTLNGETSTNNSEYVSNYAYLGMLGFYTAKITATDGTTVTGLTVANSHADVVQGMMDISDKDVYALRFYNVALTDEQNAQNHFADLMYYSGAEITDDVKLAIANDGYNFYKLFNEYKVGQNEKQFARQLDYVLNYRPLYENRDKLLMEFDLTLIDAETTANTAYGSSPYHVFLTVPDTEENLYSNLESLYYAAFGQSFVGFRPFLRVTDGSRQGYFYPLLQQNSAKMPESNYYTAKGGSGMDSAITSTNANIGLYIETTLPYRAAKVTHSYHAEERNIGTNSTTAIPISGAYYVRMYDITDNADINAETDNNRFVDVMRFYGVDTGVYKTLGTESKAKLIEKFAQTELGNTANAAFIKANIESEINNVAIVEKVGAVDEILTAYGYGARTTMNIGIRAGFSVNKAKLAGFNVIAYGAIVGKAETGYAGMTAEYVDGRIVVNGGEARYSTDGSFKHFGDAEKSAYIKENADNYDMFAVTLDFIKFTCEFGGFIDKDGKYFMYTDTEGNAREMTEEEKAQYVTVGEDLFTKEFLFRGFVIVEKDGVYYTYYINTVTDNWADGKISVKAISEYFTTAYDGMYADAYPIKYVYDLTR